MRQMLWWFIVILAIIPSLARAAAFDPATMMDSSEVKRGMRAVGKSVFAGTQITEFRLEIIGVMHQANSGGDLVLARVLDGPVVQRQSGIIGGMSGSPVYIGGRLLGAIAYGWGFPKEPIAGITCIRDMLEALEIMTAAKAAQAPREPRWLAETPLSLGGQVFTAARVVIPGQAARPGELPLQAAGLALSCSGLGKESLALVREKLEPYGIEPQSSGGPAAAAVPVELAPGAAVGVRLLEGDFDMTGIGTVTYRQGDYVLAYGHPMMQLGAVNMPLCTAWIHDFLPSYMRSNKIGSPMTNVGSLRSDTNFAVGGVVGPVAPQVPATIEVLDKTRDRRRTFNVRAMRQTGLTPMALATGVAAAIETAFNPGFEGMVRTTFEVRGHAGASVRRSNEAYFSSSPVRSALSEVLAVMQLLEDNRWQPQNIASLEVKAEISDQDETAFIERVYAEENVARAGKPLNLHVLVRPDGGELVDHKITLQMPIELPKGSLRLAICGGNDAVYLRQRMGLLMPQFDSLGSVLKYYQEMEHSQQLCVIAALPGDGLAVGGQLLFQLPRSVTGVLERSPRTDLMRGKQEMIVRQDLPWLLYGREVMNLVTEDREGTKGSVPAPPKATGSEDKSGPAETSLLPPPPDPLWWAWAQARPRPAQAWPAATIPPAPIRPRPSAEGAAETPAPAAEKKTPDKPESGASDNDEANPPVSRQPAVWTQTKGADFAQGEVKGVAVRNDGMLSLAPAQEDLGALEEFYIWSAVSQAAGTFVGTGGSGKIYRLDPQGKVTLHFATGAFAVSALALDAQGVLYAGTWPGGQIFRVAPDGQGRVHCTLPATYVWCLALDPDGTLWAGTGPEGKLYRISPQGQVTEAADLPQAHLLSLQRRGQVSYLGTAEKGVVYARPADGRLEVLLDAGNEDVTALTLDEKGVLYAGTAPGGKVFRLAPDSAPVALLDDKKAPIYSLAWQGDRLLAGTGGEGRLLALPEEGLAETVMYLDPTHLLCLAPGPGGELYLGAANTGHLWRLAPLAATSGVFTSAVLDAKRPARWGIINWQAEVPAGATLAVQTRSGNSDNPEDGSWSAWSLAYAQPGAERVTSPPARYLQYRLEMKKAAGDGGPVVRSVKVAYLAANQRPSLQVDSPTFGQALRGNAEVKWTATDPDKDRLTVTLRSRPAAGGDWTLITTTDPNKKSATWDTAKLTDGLYELQLTVSDAPSNPVDPLTQSQVVFGLRVDNTRPELTLTRHEEQGGQLVIEGLASDQQRVVDVAYRRDGQWWPAKPRDGQFDSQYEEFSLQVPLVEGKASVEIRVQDEAGNVLLHKLTWPPEAKADQP